MKEGKGKKEKKKQRESGEREFLLEKYVCFMSNLIN